jgi:hypothetical protein
MEGEQVLPTLTVSHHESIVYWCRQGLEKEYELKLKFLCSQRQAYLEEDPLQ